MPKVTPAAALMTKASHQRLDAAARAQDAVGAASLNDDLLPLHRLGLRTTRPLVTLGDIQRPFRDTSSPNGPSKESPGGEALSPTRHEPGHAWVVSIEQTFRHRFRISGRAFGRVETRLLVTKGVHT